MPKWDSAVGPEGPSDPLVPFDASRPNIARAYDYMLGGKDHFAPDRKLAEKILALYPAAGDMARENRQFISRALAYVLGQGITQYADLGAGLPTSPAVHEIVRQDGRPATVVYVDNDPVVVNHLHVFAAKSDDHIGVVGGDLTDPVATLAGVRATGLIDFGQPACLIMAMVLHFVAPARSREIVSSYVSSLAPGSYVILTVGHGETGLGRKVTAAYDAASLYNHTAADIEALFTGLEVVNPGIVDARDWRPDLSGPVPAGSAPAQVRAAVARKP